MRGGAGFKFSPLPLSFNAQTRVSLVAEVTQRRGVRFPDDLPAYQRAKFIDMLEETKE